MDRVHIGLRLPLGRAVGLPLLNPDFIQIGLDRRGGLLRLPRMPLTSLTEAYATGEARASAVRPGDATVRATLIDRSESHHSHDPQ